MVTARVNAERIIKFELNDSTMAYNLDIDILDSLGQVTSNIVGDSGVIREKEAYLNIYGNVKVVSDDSTTLETDYLYWDSRTDRIKTHTFVRIVKDLDVITGWGLDADHKLNSIKILDRVSGEIIDPEKFQEE
jgi:LPS export ABC transporter protein LptC